jgi:tetratricopeptide (TPR) repeat protein
MVDLDLLKDAIGQSNELWERGQHHEALKILDDCIAKAIQENRAVWVKILSMHASVISEAMGDLGLVGRYCEQVLAYEPENALALFKLADVLFRHRQTDLAKKYAAKSYALVSHSNTDIGRGLAELLTKKWPEVGEWLEED